MTLIVRTYSRKKGRAPYVVADELSVMHPIIWRRKRLGSMGGLSTFQQESTGKRDKRKFEVVVREGKTALGYKTTRSHDRAAAAATAAGVKTIVRRVRDQEAAAIAEADRKIAEAEALLEEARNERERAVRTAWTKANVVRLSEMEEMAEENEREIQVAAAARREEEGR